MNKVYGALLFLLFLGSCYKKDAEERKVFRYNQIGGIETLDPAFAKSLAIMWGVHFIYNTLVEVDTSLNIRPSLAKSWDISPDGLQYTFHLRTDVYFQDNTAFPGGKGRKMTAGDVAYSYNRIIDPMTASAGAWVFNGRVREKKPFVAVDDSTFVLYLKQPFRPLLEILTMPYCSVVPKEVVEKWGKDFRSHPCGTGAFQFGFWDEGNVLMLHKNPHYWEKDENGKRLPYLDGIRVTFNETRAMEFLRFRQKELDFMNGIDGAMQDLLLSKKGTLRPEFQKEINLRKRIYLNTEYLGFYVGNENKDLADNPVQRLKIRQAIAYAIDRKKIVTYFRNGIGVPATKGFIPPGMPGTENSPVKGYEYNPQKALQLLKEAGFPQGKGLPVIYLSTPETTVDICNFIASELTDIGIKVQVQVMQNGLLRQQMTRGALPCFKAQWIADYPDAETYLAFFYSKFPAPPNYTRFNNKVFDSWYEKSIQINEDSLRFAWYGRMDSLVSSRVPVVPLYYDQMLHFTQKNVMGLRSNALNIIDLKRVWKK
jgi:peptide/nickel transport system substrate-binding protein